MNDQKVKLVAEAIRARHQELEAGTSLEVVYRELAIAALNALVVDPEPTDEQYHQIRNSFGDEKGFLPAPTTVPAMWRSVLKTVGVL